MQFSEVLLQLNVKNSRFFIFSNFWSNSRKTIKIHFSLLKKLIFQFFRQFKSKTKNQQKNFQIVLDFCTILEFFLKYFEKGECSDAFDSLNKLTFVIFSNIFLIMKIKNNFYQLSSGFELTKAY